MSLEKLLICMMKNIYSANVYVRFYVRKYVRNLIVVHVNSYNDEEHSKPCTKNNIRKKEQKPCIQTAVKFYRICSGYVHGIDYIVSL